MFRLILISLTLSCSNYAYSQVKNLKEFNINKIKEAHRKVSELKNAKTNDSIYAAEVASENIDADNPSTDDDILSPIDFEFEFNNILKNLTESSNNIVFLNPEDIQSIGKVKLKSNFVKTTNNDLKGIVSLDMNLSNGLIYPIVLETDDGSIYCSNKNKVIYIQNYYRAIKDKTRELLINRLDPSDKIYLKDVLEVNRDSNTEKFIPDDSRYYLTALESEKDLFKNTNLNSYLS